MKLVRLYRASMYAMLTLATTVLSINAQDYNRLAMLYPLGVAAAGAAAFLTVDRHPGRGLSRDLANFLAMGSFVIAMLEYWVSPDALPLALGHWLVYLQILKMFLPKTFEDDWFLFLLGLVQVVIGVYLSQSHEVGILLAAWALMALWTLGLFHLHREAGRMAPAEGIVVSPQPDVRNPYPGLFNLGFVLSTFAVALTTLGLGGLIFLVMPRWSTATSIGGSQSAPQHLTGFSDEIQLGRMGEILENNNVVMTVESFDARDRKVRPSDDMLWRGITLVLYENGRWAREDQIPLQVDRAPMNAPASQSTLAQRIRLEATEGDVLFALRPIHGVSSRTGDEIAMNRLDGTLYRLDQRINPDYEQAPPTTRGTYDYVVWASLGERLPQANELYPRRNQRRRLLMVPSEIAEPLRKISDTVLGDDAETPAMARARKLEAYLRSSGQFSYTLRLARVDPTIDPVLDFLKNRHEGHCEYFASALTLLLRSQGIPARMVNGFKGGDWNELFHVMTVREKHAHSWVEALIGRDSNGWPIWLTLDPTPAQQRDAIVARIGGVPARFQAISDALRHVWVFYIVGFDQERQDRLIYGPLRELASEATRGFRMMYSALLSALGGLFYFESTREFFSWRGFLVSVVTMLLAVGAIQVFRWILGKLLRRFGDQRDSDSRLAHGMAFYHRLIRLLAEAGLERPPSETPREFARRATLLLNGRAEGPDRLDQLPNAVIEAFYRVRFGHHTLDPEALRDLETRLDTLEVSLKPTRA